MVIITLTMGQGKDDLDTMKEMIAEIKMEMNQRVAKTESELAATKYDLAIS